MTWHRPQCLAALALAAMLAGCGTWTEPPPADDALLRARAETASQGGVELRATVLGAEDSLRLFGTDLLAAGIQPVWIEIANGTDKGFMLLRSGTDPDYFSSLEVAWPLHAAFDGEGNRRIDDYFHELAFTNPIPPHATVSGIVFTNPQPVSRLMTVDLLGDQVLVPFSIFLPVPGDARDGVEAVAERFAGPGTRAFEDTDSLRAALEALPCCAQGGGGEPLNVVFVGTLADVATGLGRRGFRRIVPNAEVLAFGRPPDYEVRRFAQAGAPSDHLRLWVAPFTFQGRTVLAGQSLRPIGGRFAPSEDGPFTAYPNVDESRNLFIQDAFYSGGLEMLGFVGGVPPVPAGTPGKAYHTDGARAVLFYATRPLALSNVELLDWLPLLDEQVRRAASAAGP